MQPNQIIQKLEQLKPLRQVHENIWRECFDLTYPLLGSGFNGNVLTAESANRANAMNLDSTATDSARVLASSIQSGVTPSNSIWFGLDAGTESEQEKRWLETAAMTMWENIHMSNFDSAAYESVLTMVCGGQFALFVDEDREKGGYTFEQWAIAQCYFYATKAGGRNDGVLREYELTADQAVTAFGFDNVPKTIQDAHDQKTGTTKFSFCHAIYPRDKTVKAGKMAKNMPIASCHVEIASKKCCRESGYHEMPVIAPRWALIPSTSYAVGPVYDALADIRELNDLKRLDKSAAELAIAGMWIATDDGVLNPRSIKVGARKVIIANSVDSMKELKSSGNWQLADKRIEDLKASIRKIMMADHLQPQDGPVITATEVHVNVGLIRQLLGPIYGRMQAEYLQPLIERCFGLAYRAGVLGEAPESLLEREFHVKYLSPMARAQKMEEVTAIERFNANLGQMLAIDPEVKDVIDFDKTARKIADSLGVPVDLIRNSDDTEKLRNARNEAVARQQENAQTAELTQAAGQQAIKQAVPA